MSAHPIPPITDPYGAYWDQPKLEEITVDDTHALMSLSTFEHLSEYSATIPDGIYIGKMWKRNDGLFDAAFLRAGGVPTWKLCWFGEDADPEKVRINSRKILLSDGDLPE